MWKEIGPSCVEGGIKRVEETVMVSRGSECALSEGHCKS